MVGFIAVNLADKFKHVVGLDPSANMVAAAVQPESGAHIDYKVGNAEDLSGAGIGQGEDGLDLVVAGKLNPLLS
jgi:2-polyprenyl-3-methyl-5-hydroxy-6-metoxy-1,4-benzoquinol methylase